MNHSSSEPSEDHSPQRNQSPPGSPFRIYVGGISSSTEASEIKAYFSQFGQINSVHTFLKRSRKTASGQENSQGIDPKPVQGPQGGPFGLSRIKGFCLVDASNEETFKQILAYQGHKLDGRTVQCSEFFTGTKLGEVNTEKNSRRVIIKSVPQSVSDEELRRFLEGYAGEIEIFFCFSTDNRKLILKGKKKKHKTYSVMFKDKKSMEVIDAQPLVTLPDGNSILIRRFLHRKEKTIRNSDEKPLSFYEQAGNEGTSTDGLVLSCRKETEKISPAGLNPSNRNRSTSLLSPLALRTPRQTNLKLRTEDDQAILVKPPSRSLVKRTMEKKIGSLTKKETLKKAAGRILSGGSQRSPDLKIDHHHRLKPTSRAYFNSSRKKMVLEQQNYQYRLSCLRQSHIGRHIL